MPKSAVTFFGLALVAVSIGFNIWRYPIVWRMTGPAPPPTAKTTAALPAAPRATPAAVEPSRPSASASAVQPIKLPAAKAEPATPPLALAASDAAKPISSVATDTATDPTAKVAEQRPPVPNDLEKPLVPVPRTVVAALPIGGSAAVNTVRRLPPVDPNVPTLVGPYASGSSGAIPIYPSTGIQ